MKIWSAITKRLLWRIKDAEDHKLFGVLPYIANIKVSVLLRPTQVIKPLLSYLVQQKVLATVSLLPTPICLHQFPIVYH